MIGQARAIGRRLTKLRAMSAREVADRLRYRLAVRRERRAWEAGTLAPPDRLRRALLPALADSADWERALLSSRRARGGQPLVAPGAEVAIRHLFDSVYAAERDDMRRKAADARAHRFAFFGQTFSYGDDIAWQDDPVTGRPWPRRFHADVPVHGGDIGAGDVKHVWELSRQQYLIDLGKSVYLDDDVESLAALTGLVRSWIAGNPYATGVNWSCALEPAFRGFSWLWAYALTSARLDDAFHLEWLTGLHDHGRFIEQHLEHYSSPFNHLIGEAAALFLLGAMFPEFADAARWRASARAVLEGRLDEQFYGDGGSVEQSTFYHHATVGYYLLAACAGRAIDEPLSPRVWAAIERGLDFSLALVQPDGRTPEIGGADDGKPIRMEHLPFWDFRPYQAIGAVLFGRADFKWVAGRFHEDALWLLGPDGREAFEALPAAPPADASRPLPASGYYLLRDRADGAADYVCIDCGEQAAGIRTDAIPNSMHGHADALSVVAWLGGRRILADSGFYAYNCGGAWEAHFRETAAHNTARVDGRDQARHLAKMAWSHGYRTSAEQWASPGAGGWFVGSHDGYARGPEGVTHRRAVWLRPGGVLLVLDEFTGAGTHDLEVNYQFAPGTPLTARADGTVGYGDAAEVAWLGVVPWTATLCEGGDGPEAGWIAPSLGVRVPAPRLTLRCRTTVERTVLLTVLASPCGGAQRLVLPPPNGPSCGLIGLHGPDGDVHAGAAGIPSLASPRHFLSVLRLDGARVVSSEHGPAMPASEVSR